MPPWKQQLIRRLHGQYTLLAVSGKSHILDCTRAHVRKRQEHNIQDIPLQSYGERRGQTLAELKKLGILVKRVGSMNHPACAQMLAGFKPGYMVAAFDQLLSKRTIASAPVVLNMHCGVLPEAKGWNAAGWSPITGRLPVSLPRLAWPVYSGEIYIARDAAPGVGAASLREKYQTAALQLYTESFAVRATYERTAQPRREGKTYYVMISLLKQQVPDSIRVGQFSPCQLNMQAAATAAASGQGHIQ